MQTTNQVPKIYTGKQQQHFNTPFWF